MKKNPQKFLNPPIVSWDHTYVGTEQTCEYQRGISSLLLVHMSLCVFSIWAFQSNAKVRLVLRKSSCAIQRALDIQTDLQYQRNQHISTRRAEIHITTVQYSTKGVIRKSLSWSSGESELARWEKRNTLSETGMWKWRGFKVMIHTHW